MPKSQEPWQRVYSQREPATLSWREPQPSASLALIEEAGLPPQAAILDAGGGTSNLASELLRRGYRDVTVADISPMALSHARAGLTQDATARFVLADLREHRFARQYDLWHDRAVFHFMVTQHDRDRYLATLAGTLRPDGHLILATFGTRDRPAAANCPSTATAPEHSRSSSAPSSNSSHHASRTT
jgi:SAM-dependent methyltransferase